MTPRHIDHYEQKQLFEEPEAPDFSAAQFREHDAAEALEYGDSERLYQMTNDGIVREQALEERTKDQVTGLPMKMTLVNKLEEAMAESNNTNSPLNVGILFVDLNNLKGVNDATKDGGYSVGNEYIRANVRGISANIRIRAKAKPDRLADEVYKYGGDELVVVVRGQMTEDELKRIGDRYVVAIDDEVRISLGDEFVEKFGAGNTVGIALLEPGETAEEFLDRAGKNQQAQKLLDRSEVEKSVGQSATSQ